MHPLQRDFVYYILFVAIVFWPACLICRRAGMRQAWILTLGIPFLGLTLFSCALAFQKWRPVIKGVPA